MRDIIIEIEDASKIFRSKKVELEAVKNFSLNVFKGELLCIVGASGCGKSTLLNMIAGFIQPTSGQIKLEDTPIKDVEPRCGMIFQNYALFPWMNVIDNISFGSRLKGQKKKLRYDNAAKWIDLVGLGGFEEAYPGELSGGMQQRVALSRALANEPDVLLCDEPFAALDAMTRQLMQQELLRIVKESGKTVIFITHSIDEALILSDRLVVMSARPGRVKAVYENDLPKPRMMEVQLVERFLELKREVWDLVQEEVMNSMAFSK